MSRLSKLTDGDRGWLLSLLAEAVQGVPKDLVLAGTGHRPDKLGGYGADVDHRLVLLAEAALESLSPTAVITGMALGWDTALAEAAKNLRIPYIAAVPFIGQESRWRPEQQRRFHALLAAAAGVTIVCEGGYSPHKMQIRNRWMVDRAECVVALWDGSEGGTFNCVEYAKGRDCRLVNLWTAWQAVSSK